MSTAKWINTAKNKLSRAAVESKLLLSPCIDARAHINEKLDREMKIKMSTFFSRFPVYFRLAIQRFAQ